MVANNEVQDAITEAEVEIKAHRLGQFVNDPKNRDAILQRKKELLDKAVTFDLAKFDILTQSALARLFYNLVKTHSEEELHNDLKLCIAIGYILGQKEVLIHGHR